MNKVISFFNKNKVARLLSFVLVIILCINFFVFPVSAAEAYDKSTIKNLMSPDDTYKAELIEGDWFTGWGSSFSGSNVRKCAIDWVHGYEIKFDHIYITLRASLLYYISFYSYTNRLPAELMRKDGDVYYYKIDATMLTGNIRILLEFPNEAFNGNIDIVSCYGLRDDSIPVESVSYYFISEYYYDAEITRYRENLKSGSSSLPVYYTHYFDNPRYDTVYSYFTLNNASIPIDSMESISFTLRSPSSASFYLSILNSDGNNIVNLPVSVEENIFRSANYGFGDSYTKYPMHSYTVTSDLTGYDLTDKNLQLLCVSSPLVMDMGSTAGVEYGFFCRLDAAAVRPLVESVPWYARFGAWITNGFNSVVDAILGGSDSQNDQIANESEKMESASDELSQIGDSLNSVEKPDPDSIDISLGSLVPDTSFSVYTTPIMAFWEDPTLVSMIVIVLTLVLVSWVFFGKKG